MLTHFTARTKKETRVDLYFVSLEEAKFHNPSLTDFRAVGVEHKPTKNNKLYKRIN